MVLLEGVVGGCCWGGVVGVVLLGCLDEWRWCVVVVVVVGQEQEEWHLTCPPTFPPIFLPLFSFFVHPPPHIHPCVFPVFSFVTNQVNMTRSSYTGWQQSLFCGEPYPYKSAANKWLDNYEPNQMKGRNGAPWTIEEKKFFKTFQIEIVDMLWDKANNANIFKGKSTAMKAALDRRLCIGKTGWDVLVSGTDMSTMRHSDASNWPQSWQAVM